MSTAVGSGDALQVLERLLVLAWRVGHELAEVSMRHDLTPQQASLLRALDVPRPMHAVADALSCDPSNVTGLIDRIERLGLVERVPDPGDRRVRLLRLTPAGRRARDDIRRELLEAVVLQHIPASDLAGVRDVLDRLVPGEDLHPRWCGGA